MEEEVKNALKKCAVGFGAKEIVEEFSEVDGELKLVKRKVVNREIPPDIKAVKMLMQEVDAGILSDETIENEIFALESALKEGNFD